MTSVYRKTIKGVAEIETRANRLVPRLRGALILVDGRRSDDDLHKLISTDPDGTLQALLEQGYIESLQPPPAAEVAAEPAKRRSPTAAEPALADVRRMAAKFAERREVIVRGITATPGLSLVPPAGAFYVYPNVSGLFGRTIGERTVRSGQDVAEALLLAARIAVVPGEAFGTTEHVRMSFACSMARLREGLERLQAALA